jgi:hypothetical protein
MAAETRFISDLGRSTIAKYRPQLLAASDALDALLAPAQCPQLVEAIVQVGIWGKRYGRSMAEASACSGHVRGRCPSCSLKRTGSAGMRCGVPPAPHGLGAFLQGA